MPEKILCSIVVPVYFNEGSLGLLFRAINSEVILKNPGIDFEVIFVDDGSGDGSYAEILKLRNENPSLVRAVKFTRNFGQVYAVLAGYKYAKGHCMVNISADLQDPPSLISEMLDAFINEGYQVVIAARESRDESYYRRKTSAVFYKLMRRLTFNNMPAGGFDYALLSRKVTDFIVDNQEANPFWQGQILWTGYKTKFISYKRQKRLMGTSRWSLAGKIKYLIDGVLGYSYYPLRLISVLGILTAFGGFVYAVVIVIARFFADVPFKGWAPIMILILILSGIQMIMLGVIGEYLWRTLDQVRKRVPYIVERADD